MARTKKKARKAEDKSQDQSGIISEDVLKRQTRKQRKQHKRDLKGKKQEERQVIEKKKAAKSRRRLKADKVRLEKLESKRPALTQAELEELEALRERLASTTGAPDLPPQVLSKTQRRRKAEILRHKKLKSKARGLTDAEFEGLKAFGDGLALTAGATEVTPSSTDSEEDNDTDELMWAAEELEKNAIETTTAFEPQFHTGVASSAGRGPARTEVLTTGGRPAVEDQDPNTYQRQAQDISLTASTNYHAADTNMVQVANLMPGHSLFDAPSLLSSGTHCQELAVALDDTKHERLGQPTFAPDLGSYCAFDCKQLSRSLREESLSESTPNNAVGSSSAEKMVSLVTAIDQEIVALKDRLRELEEEDFAEDGEMELDV